MNSEVRQHRTPDDELRRKRNWRRTQVTGLQASMSWRQAAVQKDGPVQGEALVGQITKEGDIVVASDSKSKLWRDLSLKRAIHIWNIEICRHCAGSKVCVENVHQQ